MFVEINSLRKTMLLNIDNVLCVEKDFSITDYEKEVCKKMMVGTNYDGSRIIEFVINGIPYALKNDKESIENKIREVLGFNYKLKITFVDGLQEWFYFKNAEDLQLHFSKFKENPFFG